MKLDMNISVKETTVFSVFHPDAQDLYNTCSDLKKVAWELWDPSFRLNAEVAWLSFGIYPLKTYVAFQGQNCSTISCVCSHVV